MRRITIIAVHHKLQWRDTDAGHLESILAKILEGDPTVELIAEEANKLPTTVGQRIAFRFNKPWANVDMDEIERQRKGFTTICNRAVGDRWMMIRTAARSTTCRRLIGSERSFGSRR